MRPGDLCGGSASPGMPESGLGWRRQARGPEHGSTNWKEVPSTVPGAAFCGKDSTELSDEERVTEGVHDEFDFRTPCIFIFMGLLRGPAEYNLCKVPIAVTGWEVLNIYEKAGERGPKEGHRAYISGTIHSVGHKGCSVNAHRIKI